MQKGVFRELVLLRINGGKLTDESAVQRRDIDAYLPAAINYVVTQGLFSNIKSEGDRELPNAFYAYYDALPIIIDSARYKKPYFELPKKPVPLVKNQGIRMVLDDCGNRYYPLSDTDYGNADYYSELFPNQRFYRQVGMRMYLWNAPVLAEQLNCELVVSAEDLLDTDELPIQAGLEQQAIDICVQFMTGQRSVEADLKNDKKDLNVS